MTELDAETREKIAYILAEVQARDLDIPENLRQILLGTKKVVNWPITKYGCFTNREGKFFIPTENQQPFIFSTSRFSALISGRGGGKSASGAQKALRKIRGGASGAVLNPDF